MEIPIDVLPMKYLKIAFLVSKITNRWGKNHCTYVCGQSYKQFTLVNYDSRVVIWGIFQSGMTLES